MKDLVKVDLKHEGHKLTIQGILLILDPGHKQGHERPGEGGSQAGGAQAYHSGLSGRQDSCKRDHLQCGGKFKFL